jgi:hypothetical protein
MRRAFYPAGKIVISYIKEEGQWQLPRGRFHDQPRPSEALLDI